MSTNATVAMATRRTTGRRFAGLLVEASRAPSLVVHVNLSGVLAIERLDLSVGPLCGLLRGLGLSSFHRLASRICLRVFRARLRWLFTAPWEIPMVCEISAIDMST
jgi:hypothetical protein